MGWISVRPDGAEPRSVSIRCSLFASRGGFRLDRQRMQPAGEFRPERRVDHPVRLDPALAAKCLCDNPHPEMRLALRPVAGMTLVPVGLVDYLKLAGRKSLG